MKIALLGYGKMGKSIEQCIMENEGHKTVLRINSYNRSSLTCEKLKGADAAIEFSTPHSVMENIRMCLECKVPVVVGTTGWYDQLDDVKRWCTELNGSIVYASNFSIGMNLFFEINRKLAEMMKPQTEYTPEIIETHHMQKRDIPSGTSISLAKDIIDNSPAINKWVSASSSARSKSVSPSELIILSHREENVTGIHTIIYVSSVDKIEIKHEAFSRAGFANGALLAAEWIVDKKGCYEFREIVKML